MEYQAAMEHQRAQRQLEITKLEEQRMRREASQLAGRRRALRAASGVDPGSGTSLLVEQDLAADAEFQALLHRAGGATQAQQMRQQAALYRMEGKAAQTAGYFKAGSSLLSAANSYAKYKGG